MSSPSPPRTSSSPRPAAQEVGAAPALHLVVAGAAQDHVLAVGGDQLVVAGAAVEKLSPPKAADPVVATQAPNLVVAALVVGRDRIGHDLVAAARTLDPVVAGAAHDLLARTDPVRHRVADLIQHIPNTHSSLPKARRVA